MDNSNNTTNNVTNNTNAQGTNVQNTNVQQQNIQPVVNTQPTNSQNVVQPSNVQNTIAPTTNEPVEPTPNAQPVVAPMEVTPMEEQVITTHKKKNNNTIVFILVILLIVFVLFMDPILEFINKNIINTVPSNNNTSENLIDGFLKLEDNTGYIKVNNIKYYNIRKTNGTSIILNYEPYKNSSNIEKEGIYIELYNADKEILSKTIFNPSKIEKEVVRTYTFEVTNDAYTDAFYALIKTYTDEEIKSKKTLTCKYTINNDNITLNYTNTYEFINNSLQSYNINKTFTYKEDNSEVNKYKEELKKEYLNINDYNIKSEYNDTLLKYDIDLSNEIKDFKPLYKKDTIITIVKNKEELKKWKCE